MKNVSKFYTELIFTVIVAGIGSWLLAFFAWFILANFDVTSEAKTYVDFVSGILFGLIVGYKLKTLMLEHKKTGKKK